MNSLLALIDCLLSTAMAPIGVIFFSSELNDVIAEVNRSKNQSNSSLTASDIELLTAALTFAEDRRFWLHRGIDCRALTRAVVVYLRRKPIQGASTITQQLVRVVINDYRMSMTPLARQNPPPLAR